MADDATTTLLTYKFRLNPERRQHRALERILEQQRQLYNAALEERIAAYRMAGKTISEIDQSRSLTQIRGDDPAFALVQRRIQRATLKRLDRAYKAFFRRVKQGSEAPGFPKFKGRAFFDGFAFDAFQQIAFDGTGLRFAGMPGKLRVHVDRPLPQVACPKTGRLITDIKGVWFKRRDEWSPASRRSVQVWHVGFQVRVPLNDNRRGCGTGDVGADWGTSVLAALSTGETLANPRPGEADAKRLKRAQRAVARKKKGSNSRRKARAHLREWGPHACGGTAAGFLPRPGSHVGSTRMRRDRCGSESRRPHHGGVHTHAEGPL